MLALYINVITYLLTQSSNLSYSLSININITTQKSLITGLGIEIVSRFVTMRWCERLEGHWQVHERRSTTALIITIQCAALDHYRRYSNTDQFMLYRITPFIMDRSLKIIWRLLEFDHDRISITNTIAKFIKTLEENLQ